MFSANSLTIIFLVVQGFFPGYLKKKIVAILRGGGIIGFVAGADREERVTLTSQFRSGIQARIAVVFLGDIDSCSLSYEYDCSGLD